jgi:hypothetical protein
MGDALAISLGFLLIVVILIAAVLILEKLW